MAAMRRDCDVAIDELHHDRAAILSRATLGSLGRDSPLLRRHLHRDVGSLRLD